MAPDRWRQVKEVFEAAQARPPDARARFVGEACAGDEEMRREVESLLSSYDSAASFMERPAVGEVADAIAGDAPELTGGQRLSHYEIVARLGAGGMGEVFLATDTRLKRKAALKILPQEFTADQQRLRRFEQEAQTASALNHPNIITIYEVGSQDNLRFIATEYIEGQTLRDKLRGGPLSVSDALDIARQVAGALVAAHEAGIVHRDIKPENVMVRPDGLVKVLDFGIAKPSATTGGIDREAETLAKGMTAPGMILGTLHYMSPEQVRGQPLDARSDIFSLGVMVYEMLTGAMPFVKPTKSDVIAAILTETPPPLTNLRDDAPPELQRIVAKSLQKKRDDRYQTSRDLLLDLKSLGKELELTGQANRATRPTQTETGAHTTGPLSTRRFSLAQTLGLLLLAGLAVSAAWWFIARRNAQNFTPSSLKTAEAASWRSAPGEVYSTGSFSPDGSRVAFVTNASGSPNIYVKQTNANTPPVPATKDEFRNEQPIWSPDGEEIAFFSTRGGQPGLWRVAYLGGSPTLIKNVAAGNTRPCHWAKSGAFYYEEKQNLFAFDLQSGQTTQVTNFEAAKPYSLNISPDEKQVVYITAEGERWSVWAAPARGGAARQIVNSAAEIRNTVWHSDSQRILYSSLNDGVFQIFVTDGGPPAQITFGDRDSFALDVTADGGKILYGSSKEESDVWGFNLATNEEFALTSDINSELWPAIAPDNKTVAFLSIKNLSQGDKLASGAIMTKPADADTPPAQLAANGYLPAWSPDGKQLAFMRVAGKVYNLWTVKAVGGAEKQLTKDGALTANQSLLPYNRTQTSEFSWSPDASRIVYRSQKTGAQNLWLVAADGAGDTQLTNNSDANIEFHSPLWSPDGKFIVYTAKPNKAVDGKFIYRAQVLDLATKETKEVFQAEQFLRLLGWSEDGKGLIVAVRKSNNTGSSLTEVNLLEASLASGASRAIATQPSTYLYNLHLSADGRMIAYVSQQDGKDNLWLLPARGGVARKLTANNDASLYFSSLAWSPDGRLICFGKQSRFSLLSMITNFKG